MDYRQVYQRNIGVFTHDEQDRLKAAKVAIAGVGGVGGIEAATLARFGIGELAIMDPGVFDEPDMNRQFGAMGSTLGRNKALATADLLRDINPFLKLTVLDTAPAEPGAIRDFMAGSHLVIDAIDYMGFDYKALWAQTARALGLLNITAPIPGFATLMAIFDPAGLTLEKFYKAPADRTRWAEYRLPLDRILGSERYGDIIARFLDGETPYLSTCAGAAALNGGLVATEAALIISGKRPRERVVTAPSVTYVDMLTRTFEIYDSSEIISEAP
ncbi:MAG: ThiF family adenylyltransferase [Pseudomonadota bacterium]